MPIEATAPKGVSKFRAQSQRGSSYRVLAGILSWGVLSLGALVLGAPSARAATTFRASVANDGAQANALSNASFGRSISADGRYVVFSSPATNLVAGDTNASSDVFVRDTVSNTTTRISVAADGTQGNADSFLPAISRNGRYVSFSSSATNLVAGDTNAADDVFVRDLTNNTTTRVSLSDTGAQGTVSADFSAISGDGRYVEWESTGAFVAGDTNGLTDVFVRDTVNNTTVRASVATDGTQISSGYAYDGAFSANGRYVAFYSNATNLVAGDTNGVTDVFLRDLVSNTTIRVSVAADGSQSNGNAVYPALSGDGRYVVFYSTASNLVSGDTNGLRDVFVRDTVNNTTTRVNLSNTGAQATGGVSNDASITEDGRYVVFESAATNLVTGDTNGAIDTFVRDLINNTTTRVSVSSTGTPTPSNPNQDASGAPAISANGRYVSFLSFSNALVPDDTNGAVDMFVRDRASSVIGGALITEFRERGSSANDDYVELYNSTTSSLDIGGWTLSYASNGVTQTATIPPDTLVPPLGHYLLVSSGYSLANYGGTGAATGDQTLSVPIDDGSTLTLANAVGAAQDTVTFGSGLTAPTTAGQYAFVRQPNLTTSLPVTTANAFTFVAPNAGTYGSVTAALGAPGPENLASPRALLPLKVTLLDPAAAQSVSPNRVRVGAGASGTLSIRRLVTNNTGAAVTQLRFRMVNLSTLNSAGYSNSAQADFRSVASGFSTQSVATSSGNVTVYGTTPDTSIAQSLGGGINSTTLETASGVVTLSAPLGAGATRAYDFTFNVVRPGNFTILILFEELNGTTSTRSSNGVMVVKPITLSRPLAARQ